MLYAEILDRVTLVANVAQRSPILGYNHNVGYRGLIFHVQTEDSGVENPHVFTHLFQGGVILTSRKLEYDVTSSEDVVKMLMQAQHKAILKGLRRGEFDDKIDSYLGNNPNLLPRGQTPRPETGDASGDQERAASASEPAAAEATPATPVATPAATPAPAAEPEPTPALPSLTGTDALRPRRYPRPGTAGRTMVQKAPPPIQDVRSRSNSGNVLVSAPPILVEGPRRDPGRTPPRVRESTHNSIFDQNLITEKSLDEVILAYLSEDADDETT